MRVAIYGGAFKKDQDGIARTLYELTDSLLKRDIEVGVWGYTITPQNRKKLSLFMVPSIPYHFDPKYGFAFITVKLKRRLAEFKPDLIHITTPDMVGNGMIRFAKKNSIPVITSFHADFTSLAKSFKFGCMQRLWWKYLKWFYHRCHSVFVPTEIIITKLKKKGIKNVKLWARGIDSEKFNPAFRSQSLRARWNAQEKKVILYSGRFTWYKDLDTFTRVYSFFQKKSPEKVVFVLAGEGPIKKKLERRMPRAHFTGHLSREELSTVYASADIFLFPSFVETFGNVVLEALSSGLPVVISDGGGCAEIVQKSNAGFIVEARNAFLFYERCKQLIENKALYDTMRANGLKYAGKHDWDRINGELIDEYYKLINNKT